MADGGLGQKLRQVIRSRWERAGAGGQPDSDEVSAFAAQSLEEVGRVVMDHVLAHEAPPLIALVESAHAAAGRLAFPEWERVRIEHTPVPPAATLRACLFTNTPDEHFVIDRHPETDLVIVASPCSGHGFKHSAAIGEALVEMALDGTSQLSTAPFAFSRLHARGLV